MTDKTDEPKDMFDEGLTSDEVADKAEDSETEPKKVVITPDDDATDDDDKSDDTEEDDDFDDEDDKPVDHKPATHHTGSKSEKIEIPDEIANKSPEDLAADISATVLDAKRVRAEEGKLESQEEEIEEEMRRLKRKHHKLEEQLDVNQQQLQADKEKIALEAEQARRLVDADDLDSEDDDSDA